MKMRINKLLDTAVIPNNGGELRFHQRGDDFAIEVVGIGGDLMNSAIHGSEEILAEAALMKLADRRKVRVLIGGLGMGFTLSAALKHVGAKAEVVVAELVPEVVKWNRGPLGAKAGDPMLDPRATVRVIDVLDAIRELQENYDAILLDTDNGPEGLTQSANSRIYDMAGLAAIHRALRPNGILAVWSTDPDAPFTKRLGRSGFTVDEQKVFAHGSKGTRHHLWFARKTEPSMRRRDRGIDRG
ncbi:MAG TPA: MnmC family methyltransferase [Flavobacteriales bacterium]